VDRGEHLRHPGSVVSESLAAFPRILSLSAGRSAIIFHENGLSERAAGVLRTFDLLDIPVLLIDETFTVISCNDSARIFLLYEPDEMAGRTLDFLVLPDRGMPSESQRSRGMTP